MVPSLSLVLMLVTCYLLSVNYREGRVKVPEHRDIERGALLFPSFLAYSDMCSSQCPWLTSFKCTVKWS